MYECRMVDIRAQRSLLRSYTSSHEERAGGVHAATSAMRVEASDMRDMRHTLLPSSAINRSSQSKYISFLKFRKFRRNP